MYFPPPLSSPFPSLFFFPFSLPLFSLFPSPFPSPSLFPFLSSPFPSPSLSLPFPFHIPSFQSFTFTHCFLSPQPPLLAFSGFSLLFFSIFYSLKLEKFSLNKYIYSSGPV